MYIIKATDLLSQKITQFHMSLPLINNVNKKSLIIISQSKVAIIKMLNSNLTIQYFYNRKKTLK